MRAWPSVTCLDLPSCTNNVLLYIKEADPLSLVSGTEGTLPSAKPFFDQRLRTFLQPLDTNIVIHFRQSHPPTRHAVVACLRMLSFCKRSSSAVFCVDAICGDPGEVLSLHVRCLHFTVRTSAACRVTASTMIYSTWYALSLLFPIKQRHLLLSTG